MPMQPDAADVRALQQFRGLIETYGHALLQLGKLLAHPETTADQFARGCAVVAEMQKALTKARAQVAEARPGTREALYKLDF